MHKQYLPINYLIYFESEFTVLFIVYFNSRVWSNFGLVRKSIYHKSSSANNRSYSLVNNLHYTKLWCIIEKSMKIILKQILLF